MANSIHEEAFFDPNFYDPDFYDMKVGPGPRVADLYVPLALEMGGPVLEMGSGTGDVLIPIARKGIPCWGIDNSPAMLERAQKNLSREATPVQDCLTFSEAEIAGFQLNKQFHQIFFTNDVIGHLLTNDALISAFDHAATHLHRDGRIVLDITMIDVDFLSKAADPWRNTYRHRGQTKISNSERINVWERTVYCPTSCRLTSHFRYEHVGTDGTINRTYERSLCLRQRHPEEVVLAFKLASFSQVEYTPISRSEDDRAWLITARV